MWPSCKQLQILLKCTLHILREISVAKMIHNMDQQNGKSSQGHKFNVIESNIDWLPGLQHFVDKEETSQINKENRSSLTGPYCK